MVVRGRVLGFRVRRGAWAGCGRKGLFAGGGPVSSGKQCPVLPKAGHSGWSGGVALVGRAGFGPVGLGRWVWAGVVGWSGCGGQV